MSPAEIIYTIKTAKALHDTALKALQQIPHMRLVKLSHMCLVDNVQAVSLDVANELKRRMLVSECKQCPYCDGKSVYETARCDGYCETCETPFDTRTMEPQTLA